jgi:YidC/Oxa1 family membrane protein insertase
LVSFRLKSYRETDEPNSPYYEMIRIGDRQPMGMVITRNGATSDDGDVEYATAAPAEVKVAPGQPALVTFTAQGKDGSRLSKTFGFRDSTYVFDVTGEARGGPEPPSGIGLTMSQPLTELAGYRDYPTLQADVNGKVLSESEGTLEKGVQPLKGPIAYAGFGDRYFLSAFIPHTPSSGTLAMAYVGNEADARMLFEGTNSVLSRVYMGPKQLDILEAADPSLSKAIDLGFWGIIALPFLRLLKLFHRIAPNYGVAIILLTVLVRLVTLPMSIRGQRSMMRMQRLQPQVEKIREKFKDDSERLNREMVDLYKRNHVNPLGGCLPMVIQFPVFIGLYEALLNAVDLRHARFIGWIRDLSAPDCLPIPGMPAIPFTDLHGIPVLVLLMTVTAFVQQWISPRNPDPNQQKMMMYMPLVFSLIFIELPAGLSLYYFASNLLGVVQQFILNREFKQYPPVATT